MCLATGTVKKRLWGSQVRVNELCFRECKLVRQQKRERETGVSECAISSHKSR